MSPKRSASSTKQRRRRLNPNHRWTTEETELLVKHVLDAVIDKPEVFEQPTARVFYKKISMNEAALTGINFKVFRGKMRHLKASYINAAWKLRNEASEVKAQAIKNECPHWEMLHKIFVPIKKQNTEEKPKYELLWNAFRPDGWQENSSLQPLKNEGSENEEEISGDSDKAICNETTKESRDEINKSPLINTVTPAKRRGPVPRSAQVVAQMVARHETKLEFEERKWRKQQAFNVRLLEFEQELFEMRVIESQQKLEKKRADIDSIEEIALQKIIKEIEMMERVKMHELATRHNNNLMEI